MPLSLAQNLARCAPFGATQPWEGCTWAGCTQAPGHPYSHPHFHTYMHACMQGCTWAGCTQAPGHPYPHPHFHTYIHACMQGCTWAAVERAGAPGKGAPLVIAAVERAACTWQGCTFSHCSSGRGRVHTVHTLSSSGAAAASFSVSDGTRNSPPTRCTLLHDTLTSEKCRPGNNEYSGSVASQAQFSSQRVSHYSKGVQQRVPVKGQACSTCSPQEVLWCLCRQLSLDRSLGGPASAQARMWGLQGAGLLVRAMEQCGAGWPRGSFGWGTTPGVTEGYMPESCCKNGRMGRVCTLVYKSTLTPMHPQAYGSTLTRMHLQAYVSTLTRMQPHTNAPAGIRKHPHMNAPAGIRKHPHMNAPSHVYKSTLTPMHPQAYKSTLTRMHPQAYKSTLTRMHPHMNAPAGIRKHPHMNAPAGIRKHPHTNAPAGIRMRPVARRLRGV
eukprot:1161848-Pelagomonas_calceolata.AAC.5